MKELSIKSHHIFFVIKKIVVDAFLVFWLSVRRRHLLLCNLDLIVYGNICCPKIYFQIGGHHFKEKCSEAEQNLPNIFFIMSPSTSILARFFIHHSMFLEFHSQLWNFNTFFMPHFTVTIAFQAVGCP